MEPLKQTLTDAQTARFNQLVDDCVWIESEIERLTRKINQTDYTQTPDWHPVTGCAAYTQDLRELERWVTLRMVNKLSAKILQTELRGSSN